MEHPGRLKFRVTTSWLITWFLIITSFSTIGFLLVTKAIGYRYNAHVARWQKTGMIILSADPTNSKLRLEGQIYPVTDNTRIPNMLPGTYRLQVSKTGYQPWMESVTISPGYVARLEMVTLFLDDAIDTAVSERTLALLANPPVNDTVRISDGEIWYRGEFVSRFATPPTNAVLYSTGRHVLYSSGKQIRIIEIDGTHDFLLYERANENVTPLIEVDDQTIAFMDGEVPVAIQIR